LGVFVPAAAHAQSKNQKLFEAFKNAAYVLYEEKKYEEAIVQLKKPMRSSPIRRSGLI
jgi:hypothetical protein